MGTVTVKPSRLHGAFSSISAGSSHACGIRLDRTVACWGVDQPCTVHTLTGLVHGNLGRIRSQLRHPCQRHRRLLGG